MTSKLFDQELIDSAKGHIFFAILNHRYLSPHHPKNAEIRDLVEEDRCKLLNSLSWRCDRAHKIRWWKALVDLLSKIPEHAQAIIREISERLDPDIEKSEVRATNMQARWRRALYKDMAQDNNLEKWMRACDDVAVDLMEEERNLLYQCFVQKLLEKMMAAFQGKDVENWGWDVELKVPEPREIVGEPYIPTR